MWPLWRGSHIPTALLRTPESPVVVGPQLATPSPRRSLLFFLDRDFLVRLASFRSYFHELHGRFASDRQYRHVRHARWGSRDWKLRRLSGTPTNLFTK